MIAQALFAALAAAALAQSPRIGTTDAQFADQLRGAQTGSKPLPKRKALDEAAAAALERFKAAARFDPKALGFRGVEDVEAAALGRPLAVYSILTEPLSAFDGTQDPNSLLMGSARVYYPILVRGAARSSLTMIRDGAGWTMGPLDDDPPAREILSARAALGAAKTDMVFIINIGALRRNGYFVGKRCDAKNVQDADPTKAATELVAVKPSAALGIGPERATLHAWLGKLSALAARAGRWSEKVGQDATPPGPVPILPPGT